MARTRFFVLSTVFISITNTNVNAVSFSDYSPLNGTDYGVRAFTQTYGGSRSYVSEIAGTAVVPYLSGQRTATVITYPSHDAEKTLVSNVGGIVNFFGINDLYLSSDAILTSPPASWAYGEVFQNQIIDQGLNQGAFYLIASDLSSSQLSDPQLGLSDFQDITVLNGTYQNALISWGLDPDYPYVDLSFHGLETVLGISFPTASQTNGFAITGFDISAFGSGSIASGDVDASTGSLEALFELQTVTPVPEPSTLCLLAAGLGCVALRYRK